MNLFGFQLQLKVVTVEERDRCILDSNLVIGQPLTFRQMGQRKVQVKTFLLLELKRYLQVGVDPTECSDVAFPPLD